MRILPTFDTTVDRFDRSTVFGYFPYDLIFIEITPGPYFVAAFDFFKAGAIATDSYIS
jgi:hypothetical protein